MEPTSLRNYGKTLLEMAAGIGKQTEKQISRLGESILEQNLEGGDLERYLEIASEEKGRMLGRDLSSLREKGLNDDAFVRQQIEWASSFSAFRRLRGIDKTTRVFERIAEQTWPKVFAASFPLDQDLRETEDPFLAFSEWFSAMMEANRRAGLFLYETAEDNPDALQIHCTWCAWEAAYSGLGVKEACAPVCRVDDIFYPNYCSSAGIVYSRTSTIGRGGKFCDYRFERA